MTLEEIFGKMMLRVYDMYYSDVDNESPGLSGVIQLKGDPGKQISVFPLLKNKISHLQIFVAGHGGDS